MSCIAEQKGEMAAQSKHIIAWPLLKLCRDGAKCEHSRSILRMLFPCVEVAESISDAYEPSLQATSLFLHIKQSFHVEAG
jgi:hypothetical protein